MVSVNPIDIRTSPAPMPAAYMCSSHISLEVLLRHHSEQDVITFRAHEERGAAQLGHDGRSG